MKKILNHLFENKTFSRAEAQKILTSIALGGFNPTQIAAFITAYGMRNITVEELQGFRDAMLDMCLKVDLSGYNLIDLCGTGGDGKDTFNISTLSSFVVAGAGYHVAKHGNYGASTISGSSNVMEQLGYVFKNDEAKLKQELDAANICFLHAPLFHPAMRFVGPIRKELGMKTFFNMLGPILNPAKVQKQITGVYNEEVLKLYGAIFEKTGKNFGVLYGLDGYDEISLTGDFVLITQKGIETISPKQLGFSKCSPEELHGGHTVEESAKILTSVLSNEGTKAQTEVVLANAATALYCASDSLSLEDAVAKAKESLESGKAFESFKKFIA